MPLLSGTAAHHLLRLRWAAALAVVFAVAGCTGGSGDDVGAACSSHEECGTGACVDSVCVASDGDLDLDGVYNRAEARLGTDPSSADSDGDGYDDLAEIVDTLNPMDSDGDGLIDALESRIDDRDGDCLPDQADDENDIISGAAATYLADVCRRGVCGTDEARDHVTVSCEGGVLRCVVEGLEAPWFAEEIDEVGCADDLDNDCDGLTDEGSPDTDGDGLLDCEDPDDDDDGLHDEDDCLPTDDGCQTDCSDGDDNGIPDCAQNCVEPYEETCDDGVACTRDTCDEDVGCIHTPRDARCDDDNPCTTDICEPSCSDGEESCSGCVHEPDPEGVCTDDNECTIGDSCQAGSCVPGPDECDCTEDVAGACDHLEDGNLCNGTLYCDTSEAPYKCVVKTWTVIHCNEDNDTECVQNQCDGETGFCSLQPINEGGACDDGSSCSGPAANPDYCEAGVCRPGELICDCIVDEDCRTPDINLCEVNPYCDSEGFVCRSRPANPDCPEDTDEGDCFASQCVPATGLCEVLPVDEGSACDDGYACTAQGSCDSAGVCQRGAEISCDDAIDCTADSCAEPGGCIHEPNHDLCADDDVCTEDVCLTEDEADPEPGCVHRPLSNLPCDDDDECTTDDHCRLGVCRGTEQCECRSDADCAEMENGDRCDGTLVCDFSEENFPYACVVDPETIPEPCDDSADTFCLQNRCVPETGLCEMRPANEDEDCDDQNECTARSVCTLGSCWGFENITCGDDIDCTVDGCSASVGCVFVPNDDACPDDGNPCTASVCDAEEGCGHEPGACSCLAVVFDGTGAQRLYAPDDDALRISAGTGFTVEFWVKPGAAGPSTGGHPLVSKMSSESVGDWAVLLREQSAVFRVYRDGEDPLEVVAAEALPLDTWTHVAAVYDPMALELQILIAGVSDAATAWTGTPATGADVVWMGPLPTAADPNTNAALDEVRIWSFARAHAQITADYQRALYGAEDGLTAYWRFDDVSGASPTTSADLTGNGHDLWFAGGAPAPTTVAVDILDGCTTD